MGSIRRLDANVDIQAFPGAHFIINDNVPAAQCSEAQIETDSGISSDGVTPKVSKGNLFAGWDLVGKVCHITASVGGNLGDFGIIWNSDHVCNLDGNPGAGNPVTFHITDGGALVLTRNEASFAAYIHAAGYAYTFKGGKLYTDMPSGQLKDACTILFDPIT